MTSYEFLERNSNKGFYYLRGREPLDEDGEISHQYAVEGLNREMLKYIPNRKISSIDGQIITRTLYDELWGIHDHQRDENPLSLALLLPNETPYGKNNLIELRLRIYIETGINKYTGLSFAEYLQLPRHYQSIITKVCDDERRKDSKKNADMKEEFDNLLNE